MKPDKMDTSATATSDIVKESWQDWAQKIVSPNDLVGFFKTSFAAYAINSVVIQPTGKALRSVLDYAKTDDPETSSQKTAVDNYIQQQKLALTTLELATQRNINRVKLAKSFYDKDVQQALSPSEKALVLEAAQSLGKDKDSLPKPKP